jgi:hypothetical protein
MQTVNSGGYVRQPVEVEQQPSHCEVDALTLPATCEVGM